MRSPHRSWRSISITAATLLPAIALSSTIAPRARAQDRIDKMACVRAYEDAQTLRKAGKLRASRAALDVCKSDKCPEALRSDCKPWAREVDEQLVTVVLTVRTKDAHDLAEAHVTIDGEPLTEKIDGWAITIDPGPHTLRFEAPGYQPGEVKIVAKEGERRRPIDVVLAPIEAKPAPAVTTPPPVAHEEPVASRPAPTGAYVLGGIGVVGVGAFGYFAASGLSQKSDLDRCKPSCAQSAVDDAKRTFLIGDIALGVGVVSLAAAAYLFLTRDAAPAVTVDAAPTAKGATFTLRGAF